MVRKSKRPGGNFPLTHYERTKKFASSEYGTTSRRLAGHSQYQLGDCALSLTRLSDSALCTPSGYLYSEEAILDFLLTKTQEIKEQQDAYDKQTSQLAEEENVDEKQRAAAFEESQTVIKKHISKDVKEEARQDLKKSSFWLADSQPQAANQVISKPPERPLSPHSQQPLRRKDLWPVSLKWESDFLSCSVSGKTIKTQAATVYWIDKKQAGHIVLTSVYDQLIKDSKLCPVTQKKIKYTRELQQSGTSYASSGQQIEVKKYRPTIT